MSGLPSRNQRIESLDSLRGIAALCVVMHHVAFIDLEWLRMFLGAVINIPPINYFMLGRPPVMFFFVLSGYVLALPFLSGSAPAYKRYLIRRFFRIYLPYAAVILLVAALYALVQPHAMEGAPIWLNEQWSSPPAPQLLLSHLAMTGTEAGNSLNGAGWSLVYEMRISLFFPLLVLLATRLRWQLALVVATVLMVGCLILSDWPAQRLPQYSSGLAQAVLDTLYFVWFFTLGIVMASHRAPIRQWLQSRKAGDRLMLGMLALLCFAVPFDAVNGGGAAITIALAESSAALERFLMRPLLRWLGRISYSLYLVHLPIVLAVVHLAYGRLASPLIMLLALICIFPLAALSYRFIEVPFNRWGHRLSIR